MSALEVDDIADVIAEAIKEATAPLIARIETLEKSGMKFCGTWQRAMNYERGATVSHSGSLWVAIRSVDPDQAPGADSGWQLAVKRGRDGKDAQ